MCMQMFDIFQKESSNLIDVCHFVAQFPPEEYL